MGALVFKRGTFGQWGLRQFVSTRPAEAVCRRVWNNPAELADITFEEGEPGEALGVDAPPAREGAAGVRETIRVRGWAATRSGGVSDADNWNLPVLWTPSIKALWAPFVPLPAAEGATSLPLHRLRLSAASARVQLCAQAPSNALGVPLPVGLSVEGLRVEIGPEGDDPF